MKNVPRMAKRKSYAFGKDVYLMGKDKNESILWLEAPSFDCKWYWGFGYLEEYTQPNSPSSSRDISMHTHVDSHLIKPDKSIDVFLLTEGRTFNKAEGLKLNKLFTKFYALRKQADAAHKEKPEVWKAVNEILIPNCTKQIIEILMPELEAE